MNCKSTTNLLEKDTIESKKLEIQKGMYINNLNGIKTLENDTKSYAKLLSELENSLGLNNTQQFTSNLKEFYYKEKYEKIISTLDDKIITNIFEKMAKTGIKVSSKIKKSIDLLKRKSKKGGGSKDIEKSGKKISKKEEKKKEKDEKNIKLSILEMRNTLKNHMDFIFGIC